jgi:hypothetical protein
MGRFNLTQLSNVIILQNVYTAIDSNGYSLYNAVLTKTVFVSFRDINITRQTSFIYFLFVRKNSFTAMPTAFSKTNTSCVPKFYQTVYCCLMRYFLYRVHTAECLMNGRKGFRCVVMFQNGHIFSSWIHYARLLYGSCATDVISGIVIRVTLTQVSLTPI